MDGQPNASRLARRQSLTLASAVWLAAGPRVRDAMRLAAADAAEAFEGGCVVRLIAAGGRLEPHAVAHCDADARTWLRGLLRTEPAGLTDAFNLQVVRSREPVVLTNLTSDLMRLLTPPSYWPFLAAHDINSLTVMPLGRGRRISGTLTVWRERPRAPFVATDIMLAEDLARRLSVAAGRTRTPPPVRPSLCGLHVANRAR
jgi:GAF domain-containing protein